MTDRFYELILPLNILFSLFIAELLIKFISVLSRTLVVQALLIIAFTALFIMVEKQIGFEVEGENL